MPNWTSCQRYVLAIILSRHKIWQLNGKKLFALPIFGRGSFLASLNQDWLNFGNLQKFCKVLKVEGHTYFTLLFDRSIPSTNKIGSCASSLNVCSHFVSRVMHSKSIPSILLNSCSATTIICYLHFTSICLWQTVKSIHTTQEQPEIIACIPVARISKNLQFFTKDPGSGIVFLPLLPICQAFLLLKTKC